MTGLQFWRNIWKLLWTGGYPVCYSVRTGAFCRGEAPGTWG